MTIRCPGCNGLRSTSYRNRQTKAMCPDCRSGKVIPRSQFHNYWLTRYTMEEIRDMGKAIWG